VRGRRRREILAVALAHEEVETYDAMSYETQLVRAVESVLLPLG
jgi:DNA polymerase I